MSCRGSKGLRRAIALGLGAVLAVAACSGPPAGGPGPMLVADPPEGGDDGSGAGLADFDRGVAFIKKEAFAQAVPFFDKALEANPEHARAAYYRAVAQERLGQREEAEKGYERALAIDPALVDAAVNLGALYLDESGEPPRKAQPDKAIAVLQKAAETVPDDPGVQENLGFAHRLKGDVPTATKHYEKALKLGGGPQTHFALGDMLFEAEQCDPAAKHLGKAIAGFSQDVRVLVTLGELLGRCKAWSECVRALDGAIKLQPNEAGWYVRRGVCHHGTKDESKARKDFQTAVDKEPKHAAAYYYLGQSWRADKNRLKAGKAFEKAIELDPKGPIGKKARAAVDDMLGGTKRRKKR